MDLKLSNGICTLSGPAWCYVFVEFSHIIKLQGLHFILEHCVKSGLIKENEIKKVIQHLIVNLNKILENKLGFQFKYEDDDENLDKHYAVIHTLDNGVTTIRYDENDVAPIFSYSEEVAFHIAFVFAVRRVLQMDKITPFILESGMHITLCPYVKAPLMSLITEFSTSYLTLNEGAGHG